MDFKRDGEQRGPFKYGNHRRPVTRREFLGQGFITGAATIAAPSLLGLIKSPEARAQALADPDCGIGGLLGNRLPFIVFDLGGGASTCGSNVLVTGPGGSFDEINEDGYSKFGLPVDRTPTFDPNFINTELGLPFHSESALLAGIKLRAQPTTLARVNGAVFCARSDNDTGNNPHNPMYGVYHTGRDGELVTLIGSRASDSGGKSMVATNTFDPSVRPTKIDRPSDATGLVDTGKLANLLGDQAGDVMEAAQRISDRKVDKILEGATVSELIQCSYRQSTHLVDNFGDPDDFDPLQDDIITNLAGSIFPPSPGDPDPVNSRSEFRKTASVMKLVANQLAGAGTIEFGGYDYHDSTRATGERKDRIAGECIGAVLEYAARLPVPTPMVVYILTDGSVASDGVIDNSAEGGGKGIWKGDNSSTAGTIMLVFDPDGRPAMNPAVGNQIGYFRANASVDTDSSIIADSVNNLAQAAILNYVSLHNDVTSWDATTNHGLGGNLGSLTAFAPLNRFLNPIG
jgi:hypothetical protein